MDWQPLGTEPKDGTKILTWFDGRIDTAWWQVDWMDKNKQVLGGKSWCYAARLMPTHWAPMPPGPDEPK